MVPERMHMLTAWLLFRVAYAKGAQSGPPLGWTGTVVGLYDNAAEVLWDRETPAASPLHGR